ncbi:STRN4 protein, partial [Paradoxornis webbianus]|nr:STRN4 protein [Sinosuthora webbiana]
WQCPGEPGGGPPLAAPVPAVPTCPQVSPPVPTVPTVPTVPRCPQVSPPVPRCPQVSPAVPPGGSAQVNQVVTHPWQPLTITASDDRAIRYLDNRTGHDCSLRLCHLCQHTCVQELPAHLCPLCDLTCVPSLSPGHDCSLRLWHLCQHTCVQELPAHRRKHHEAVLGVAFHPRRPLSASAGADGLAKVFV